MSAPVETQEAALVKYRDEADWTISVSDKTFETILRSRGWKPERREGDYCVYRIPAKAITVRSRRSLKPRSRGRSRA